MSFDELMEAGAYCEDAAFNDVSDSIAEYSLTAHVSDIIWDLTEEDLFGTDFETVDELVASLPTEMDITVKDLRDYTDDHEENEKDAISDEIFNQSRYLVSDFKYTVTKIF